LFNYFTCCSLLSHFDIEVLLLFSGFLLAQAVNQLGDQTGSNIAVWGSIVSGIGIAGGAIIAAWFQGVTKLRETDQKSIISDLNHEIERLKEDVQDLKTKLKDERDARLRVEADFERYRQRSL
jgi:hypothetical protein